MTLNADGTENVYKNDMADWHILYADSMYYRFACIIWHI